MSNPLVVLRNVLAPSPRRRTATVARILPGGRVELALPARQDTSTPGVDAVPAVSDVYAWADGSPSWSAGPASWSGIPGRYSGGTTAARPVVYCGVAVAVGDRVLVEGDRIISKLVRYRTRTVRVK